MSRKLGAPGKNKLSMIQDFIEEEVKNRGKEEFTTDDLRWWIAKEYPHSASGSGSLAQLLRYGKKELGIVENYKEKHGYNWLMHWVIG